MHYEPDELNRYITHSRHCDKDAEIKVKTVVSAGYPVVEVEIRVGGNPQTYAKCMEAAGYEQKGPPLLWSGLDPPAVERTVTVGTDCQNEAPEKCAHRKCIVIRAEHRLTRNTYQGNDLE